MKLFLGSILIIVAGFSVNKYVFSSKAYDGVSTVTDIISVYPVNMFDFKKTMEDYAHHLCYKNEATLNTQHITVTECLSQHENKKLECEKKVFRLAPLNLESEVEVLDYSRQYTQCTLPYKYILG
ncbi:hypothetical protein PC2016_1495 [Pseudoalteromonas carrageenovora]|uniref:Orphan protein n=1 Tax=Pseudoalteromonas carrageenovora IAM 12662 TaxID=1314868 RepID=A0A2K4X914_PSEVC|nr:hypothetical protein [Pseudoalteromonas carrageenovora]MBE0383145.1 hypothetical protein [Pseudoalteromonas carrageenovora IAM 12662]QBJ71715.1 hypothetical protein PC2016_1495 [Pseudoalteromonas carrageenovora]GEB71485.1 hypothetical protein PCA01_21950 [Pseudoalteromonas carrageenovora]SOU40807.1 conserved protein of unknown function [Pseudoalteromonas carrageenovora IAM 12662]